MFCTQIYGTIIGGFINYAVMISIVKNNRELLAEGNGDSSWSGATMQSYNTNAASWALASRLYKSGGRYEMVPIGLAIGAGIVIVHRLVVIVSRFTVPSLQHTKHAYIVLRHLRSFPRLRVSPFMKSICRS